MTRDTFLSGLARLALAKGRNRYAVKIWDRMNEELARREAEKSRNNARRRARRERGRQLVDSILTEKKIERMLGDGYRAAVLWS